MNKKTLMGLLISLSLNTNANYSKDILSWLNTFDIPKFDQINDTKQRKTAFLNYLTPIIHQENNKISLLRNLLKHNQLNKVQIDKLGKKYRLKNSNKSTLLNAIDVIPTSLVLAQAAIESNWGRSRFAKRWHNYFGIWCFKPGCGVVPIRRDKGAKHEVAKFSSVNKAIEYYILNINRNHAYRILRQIRAKKRDAYLPLTGISLAEGLGEYAATGYEYVELVQGVIRQNQLETRK